MTPFSKVFQPAATWKAPTNVSPIAEHASMNNSLPGKNKNLIWAGLHA